MLGKDAPNLSPAVIARLDIRLWDSTPSYPRLSSHRLAVIGYRHIGVDLVIGFLARNGDGGDDDGPRAMPHPTLTCKIPQYADCQPYNGKAMGER